MVARRPDRLTILVGVTLLAVAFFILPTRVHERYLYPFFALGAILAAISPRWLLAYVVLSAATFLNMYVVVTTLYPGNPAVTDWLGIGEVDPELDRGHGHRPGECRRRILGVPPDPAGGHGIARGCARDLGRRA